MTKIRFVLCMMVAGLFAVGVFMFSAVGVLRYNTQVQEAKVAKLVSVKTVNTDGSTTNVKDTNIRLTNNTANKVSVCVRGYLTPALNKTDKLMLPPVCINNIPAYSTVNQEVGVGSNIDKITEICFDVKRYNSELAEYREAMEKKRSMIADYEKKAASNPIYENALNILRNKAIEEPEKKFSWDYCSFDIEDAFPDLVQ